MSLKTKEKILSKTTLPSEGIASFIRKTYEILEDSRYQDVIGWSDDGNFVIIKDVEELCNKVLPVHFKHSNFTSFVRQLNIYNFHKKKTFNSQHVYYHELFKRGKVDLLKHIKRKNERPSKPINITSTMIDNQMIRSDSMLSQTTNNSQINQENMMLKQLNQKALARINFLETKINDILAENRVLLKRISEKQESEENLKSVIYNYFQANRNQVMGGVTSSANPITQKLVREKSIQNEQPNYQRQNRVPSNEQIVISGSALTPETMPSDSPTNMMNEQQQIMMSSASIIPTNTNNQNSFDNQGYPMANPPYNYDDFSLLGKRTANQNEVLLDHSWLSLKAFMPKDNEINEGESKKICNFDNYKDTEKEKMNLMEVDFPLFSEDNLIRDGKYLASTEP